MNKRKRMLLLAALGVIAVAGVAWAQLPRPDQDGPPPREGRRGDRPQRRPEAPPPPRDGRRGDRPAPRLEGPPPVDPVRAALDADGDGAISADEIAGAIDALKKLDRNGDGKLSREELRPDDHPPRGPRPGERLERPRTYGSRGERPPGPELGAVLPPFAREPLHLTSQQQQIAKIESNVKQQLQKVLTEEQQQRFAKLAKRGPQGGPPRPPRGPRAEADRPPGPPHEPDGRDGYGYPRPRD